MTSMPAPQTFRALLDTCDRSPRVAGPVGWLIDGAQGAGEWSLVDRFEAQFRDRGGSVTASGGWRRDLCRPFGGLADLADRLAARAWERHPEVVHRYSLTLASLAPMWRQVEALRHVRVLSSGLADFALSGDSAGLTDFYWKRDNAPKIIADLVYFFIDSAEALAGDSDGRPVILRLDGLELADAACLGVLHLLGRYAGRTPLVVIAEVPSRAAARLAGILTSGWRRLSVSDAAQASGPEVAPLMPAGAGLLLAALSVCARPCPASVLRTLMADAWMSSHEPDLDACVSRGLLRAAPGDVPASGASRAPCFTFAAVALRDFLYDRLDLDLRRRLHLHALDVEQGDSFAASWHARASGVDQRALAVHTAALAAAWAVSHHDSILALATRLLAAKSATASPDPDVLLALAHYDAGRGREADEHLRAAVERQPPYTAQCTRLTQMLGYNAIFVLNDFERGRRLLEDVLDARRRGGRESDVGFLRNTMAYALFRSGRVDEAVRMEQQALASLERAGEPTGFLSSILQLNLGRLQRNLGNADRALDLLTRALNDQSWDVSPYMLLIFHSARALLHSARGDHQSALEVYHRMLSLARNVKLEYATQPVSTALVQASGVSVTGQLTRSDEILFQLYLNTGLCCRRLGRDAAAETYRAGLRTLWGFLPDDVWSAVDTAWTHASLESHAHAHDTGGFDADAEAVIGEYRTLVRAREPRAVRPADAAALLAEGKVIGIARPQRWDDALPVVESVVLYHPGRLDVAKGVNAEIGSAGLPQARSMLVLEEDAAHFPSLRADLPRLYQQTTLPTSLRARLRALEPIRVRAQIVRARDELFGPLLREFRLLTGLGVLAAVPFHLRGRDLATTPAEAMQSFLISSLDDLLLGDRLIEKIHGVNAPQNLLPFRPRLSRHASLREQESTENGGLVIRIWIASYKSEFLRLRRELKPLFDRCDGSRNVATILDEVRPLWRGEREIEARACGLLRDLWHRDVIRFDWPTADRSGYASA